MKRYSLLMLLATASAAAGQSLPAAPEPIAELPGSGRPIPIAATEARRTALAKRVGRAVIAIPAAGLRDLEDGVLQDNDFRQNDYFFYLTGLESPDAWLVIMSPGGGAAPTSHLFLPPRDGAAERWTGAKMGPDSPDAVRLIGIPNLHPTGELGRFVRTARGNHAPLYTLLYAETQNNTRVQEWVGAQEGIDLRNIIPVLDSMRLVKDRDELDRLERSIDITVEAQRAAMQAIRPGMHEYEVEAVIEYTFRSLGADRVGFPSIIGSGPNSTVLHYDVNRRRIRDGDLVVMDIGAEYGQYTADVTRTVPVDGRFSQRQKAIYTLVLGAQQAAIDAVRPGVTIRELSQLARQYIRDRGGDLCGEETCDRYYIHGLSHWLGMRVHDVGDYTVPLQPGMVFTIEPGVYLPSEALGVRIEDDVLVTETGSRVLSAGAPRSIEEIEALMRRRPQIP